MAGTPLVFNSISLQTDEFVISSVKQKLTKRADVFALSHANRSSIPYQEYPLRIITVEGSIIGTSIDGADASIDKLYDILRTPDGTLDVGWNGGLRRYVATAEVPDIERAGGLAFAKFTVNFICTRPFGWNITPTTAVSATGRTSATYSDSYTFLGTAPFQQPIITVTYTAISGGTAKTVVIGSNNTSQAITVTRNWVTGDVLQINTTNSTVTINGTLVDFTGAFPTFQPGAQGIAYSDNFTTRTFNYNVSYNVMYL